MPRFFLIKALTVLLLFTASSCAVNPVTGKKELSFVSEASEIEMGQKFYPSAIWAAEGGGGEYRDDQLKAYLSAVVVNIHKNSHRPNLPVSFAIQNSSVPNAWAIPGHVVITRGLLAGLRSEAEFAFVMGHEMGHVAARHSASQMTKSMIQQVGLMAVAVGMGMGGYGDYTGTALKVGAVGSSMVLLKYSRSDELEADRLGMEYMAKLGYDPRSAATAHRNLETTADEYMASLGKKNGERSFYEELLSSHPRTSVRIEELEKMRQNLPPHQLKTDATGAKEFNRKVTALRKKNLLYRDYYDKAITSYKKEEFAESERLVDEGIKKAPTQPPFHVLKGFLLLKKDKFKGAEAGFKKALQIEPEYQPAIRGMGALHYKKGDYPKSMNLLKKALEIYPDDLSSHYYLGMGFYQSGKLADARAHLEKFARSSPKEKEIHALIGSTYEFSGDFISAYRTYQKQIQVSPTNEAGLFANERATLIAAASQQSKDGQVRGLRPAKYRPKK